MQLNDIRTKKARRYGIDYLHDTRRKKEVHELHKKWTAHLETQLISLYKSNYQFSFIRDYFKSQTQIPAEKAMFTVISVRSKLFKIIREAIRKLYYYIGNFGKNLP